MRCAYMYQESLVHGISFCEVFSTSYKILLLENIWRHKVVQNL
jgi:hypothetical protein